MLLYLLRSLKRRPLRHFSIFWIMLCAFLLPLTVSVYRDSMIYGSQLQLMDLSKGSAVHIYGVQPEDTELLSGIDGLTEPYYEDHSIYLNFASDEVWERYSDIGNQVKLSNQIKSLLAQNGRSADEVEVVWYPYHIVNGIQEDTLLFSLWQKLRLLSFALSLASGLILYSACRNHIDAFSSEIAELSAIGAEKRQIAKLFLLELGILFPLAAGGAVGIAYAVNRLIYQQFLQKTVGSQIVWQVFRMDPKNTAVLIGFYLLVCLGTLLFALARKPGEKQIRRSNRRAAPLNRLWLQNTRPPIVQCLLLLIPLTTAFIVLFNQYLGSYANDLERAQTVKITLGTWKGFTREQLDFLLHLDGIQSTESLREDNEIYNLDIPDGNTLVGRIHRYSDYAPEEAALEKYQFAVNFVSEYESEEPYTLWPAKNYRNQTALTLVRRITPERDESAMLDIYLSDALMDELLADAPIVRLTIFTTREYASAMEETIRSRLSPNYLYSNSETNDIAAAKLTEGQLWLLSWIFGTLMIVSIQIVWVRLSSYVRENGPMLQIIHQVGASRRQVAGLIPIRRAAVCAAAVPFAIAIPFACRKTGQLSSFLISLPLAGIYLSIAVLTALAFLLPVRYTLHRCLK